MFACEVDVAVAVGIVPPSLVTMAGFWMLLESVESVEVVDSAAGIVPSEVATMAGSWMSLEWVELVEIMVLRQPPEGNRCPGGEAWWVQAVANRTSMEGIG